MTCFETGIPNQGLRIAVYLRAEVTFPLIPISNLRLPGGQIPHKGILACEGFLDDPMI